jgi:transcriptional regulator with XRE-family HTH domain
MSKRSQRRREIERLFALRDREGLSLRELAEHSGIPCGTLSWWSHQLRQETRSEPAFATVEVVDLDADAVGDGATDAELVVRYPSGVVVELRGVLANRIADDVVSRLSSWS